METEGERGRGRGREQGRDRERERSRKKGLIKRDTDGRGKMAVDSGRSEERK